MSVVDTGPAEPLAKLREEFPAHQISKLPKESRAQIDERKTDRTKGVNCQICGSWHHKNAVHLDYVGHAALTDRLLDTDMHWSWEPVAFTAEGTPAFDRNGGLWIRLTVCGVTRLGYGAADGKSGGDAVKEIIGDALRNAAMRFGAALDLWHKGDLHLPEEEGDDSAHSRPSGPKPNLGPSSEGPDFYGCDGQGLSAYQAKKDGLDIIHDQLRHAASEIPNREALRTFCETHRDQIARMPRAWRVELRAAVDDRAAELGLTTDRRAA